MGLKERIVAGPQTQPDLRVVGSNEAVMEIPLVRIQIRPGYITYEDLTPLIASDGAPIAASTPGTWGQLYAAGRMG